LLIVLLLGVQYRLWFAEGSLAERTRLEGQLESQKRANRELRERNAVLEREVLELQTGNSTVEQRAREQLGLVRKGETFFQIVPSTRHQVVEPEAGPPGDSPRMSTPPGLEPAGDTTPPPAQQHPTQGDRQ
jgi:cell division protein FtsB